MRLVTLASFVAVTAMVVAATSLLPLSPTAESAAAPDVVLGPRLQFTHPGKGHEIHLSGVSVAAAPDGGALVTWGAEEKAANQIYVARFGTRSEEHTSELQSLRQ